jgi:hypothetical protein
LVLTAAPLSLKKTRYTDFSVRRGREIAWNLEKNLGTEAGRKALFERLLVARLAVAKSEISTNPRGKILEPGFRVIFPLPKP